MPMKSFFASALAGALIFAAGAASAQTVGPSGETATPSADITLSDADIAAVKDKGYKAALLWHTSSDFTNAVTAGAKDEFARAGIEVTITTDAGFDAARQAVKDGTKLVFLSNLPNGYKHGTDYAAIVTDDLFQMGKQAADALARAIDAKGQVG